MYSSSLESVMSTSFERVCSFSVDKLVTSELLLSELSLASSSRGKSSGFQ